MRLVNWRKDHPYVPKNLWNEWLSVRRSWGGRIITVHVKHWMLELDFRFNWIDDMRHGG